jgi:hypothetical protein
MDHNDVRELLEDAAVEPGGLERLMAGDTPNAALVAGHLAGCAECAAEMERLRRSVGMIRPAVQAVPPPELRERTLAYVAALGRPRGTEATELAEEPAAPAAIDRAPVPVAARRRPRYAPLLAMAAVLVLAVVGTGLAVNASRDTVARGQAAEIEALGDVARWTLDVDAQPDAKRIELASANGDGTNATLLYSPKTSGLVVVAEKLVPPPNGKEYRCWVEIGGQRQPIGRMFFGGDLAYWVGDVPEVAGLDQSARFGVSLIDLASPQTPGQPVLVGEG